MPESNKESKVSEWGGRVLETNDDPFKHNAWDKSKWTQEQDDEARKIVISQYENKMSKEEAIKYNDSNAASYWDTFYTKNEAKFFKDRHWLSQEFPQLFSKLSPKDSLVEPLVIMEIGCGFIILGVLKGTGATVFPLLYETKESKIMVHCCDYSKVAIDLVKSNPDYDVSRCNAFVYDLTSSTPPPISPNSVDVITLIFVLSALDPITWSQAIQNINYCLKPGGFVAFRDYARHDLAQLRFKPNRCLDDNFYIRGDSTRVYFFTLDEISTLFNGYHIDQNVVDRRLIVNRKEKLQMNRAWIQGKFRKPE